jgi:hypothetical protein
MFKRYSRFNRFVMILVPLFVLVVLLVASVPTQAGNPADPAAPTVSFICTPIGVAEFTTRVHVRCNPADGAIAYFAYCSANNSSTAARFLSVFIAAKATGKNIAVYYTASDTSGTACGCSSGDCRVVTGAEIQQ